MQYRTHVHKALWAGDQRSQDIRRNGIDCEQMRERIFSDNSIRLAVADTSVMNHGIEGSELINLIGKCLVWAMLVRSPTTTDSAGGSLFCVSSARCWLRACNTTSCPCSTRSCAAARPKPSDDPVMKIRAMTISYAVRFLQSDSRVPMGGEQAAP